MIKLVPIKSCDINKLYEMHQDIPLKEIGSSNIFYGISYDEFVLKLKEYINEENIINKDLNTTTKRYILVIDNEYIGELGIRTTQNSFWVNKGSQIYYKIRLNKRGKGYGNLILKLGLVEAKRLGFNKIRINCNDSNIPSKKVILNNGGVLDIDAYYTKEGTSSSYIINL